MRDWAEPSIRGHILNARTLYGSIEFYSNFRLIKVDQTSILLMRFLLLAYCAIIR
jgi:hypothetical protein